MTQPAALFEIAGLRVEVPGRRLIDGLDLRLPAGRVTGLLGHNGSGKSTLLKCLARQTAFSGSLRYRGRALAGWSARALARDLAYLPQHLPAAEGMLVRELVALGRYPWHGALGRAGPADRAAIARALDLCGLGPLAERQVDTLSGGEAQRAWIAMLVAQEAGCLLLDEPISALDIAHQVEVLSLVRRMSTQEGRAVVVVLHDLNMAARFCDHIVAMKGGALAFRGAPAEMMAPAVLGRIYGVEMEILSRADGSPVALPQ
ncbi:ABC transporter ATP-binding protein [Mangrovicoccus algicola]|uniref:ATP-binding cassette domain-containing protein n=1 Tax=Mangrovicoccus algicola TaxID=2771008 RepID=A0A8J6YVV3_9RHOB|nr:ATP-binding cassette domain-containing protein [Mangrovicoccus algicola]MBE3640173.1 ATP-binding cassette domain-containing protein [Mangrovicoccus algicola]